MNIKKRLILSGLIFFILISIKNTFAAERDVYSFSWLDPDKEIYVLQNRKYRKVDRLYIQAGYGFTTSGAFVDSSTMQAKAGYFFQEEWGIQFNYAKNSGKENDAAKSVRNPTGPSGSKPFRRIVDDYQVAMVVWSPFYGKLNTFNTIVYYDWILGLGYGKLNETNNREEFEGLFSPNDISESHSVIAWEVALQFYLNRNYYVRLDLDAQHYKAQAEIAKGTNTEEAWYSNYDISFAFGYTF